MTKTERNWKKMFKEVPPIIIDEKPYIIKIEVPNNGDLTYEGKVNDILRSLEGLLGKKKVHLHVEWDVLED